MSTVGIIPQNMMVRLSIDMPGASFSSSAPCFDFLDFLPLLSFFFAGFFASPVLCDCCLADICNIFAESAFRGC